ncbi:MAG: phosphatase PAP2 family protein [Acidobacteriota bacterium]
METWALAAAAYGAAVAGSVLIRPVDGRTRAAVAAAAVAYAALAVWAGAREEAWVHLLAPGAALLVGYWLPERVFDRPQAAVEARLAAQDARLFARLDLDRRLVRAPIVWLEILEATYASDYVLVGGGALLAAAAPGLSAAEYWAVVLPAELACYAALPWIRTRPPRAVEGPGVLARRGLVMRRVNEGILGRLSVQVNTIPSGHVAGAVASALALSTLSAWLGAAAGSLAAGIAIAAVLGRYHYAADVVSGAVVAVLAWLLAGPAV